MRLFGRVNFRSFLSFAHPFHRPSAYLQGPKDFGWLNSIKSSIEYLNYLRTLEFFQLRADNSALNVLSHSDSLLDINLEAHLARRAIPWR